MFEAKTGRQHSAFTLFEAVIVMALLSILGVILAKVLIPSVRAAEATQGRIDIQQKCLILFRRMENDLQQCTTSGISISSTSQIVAGQSVQELSSGGAQVFEQELWVYYLSGLELRTGHWTSPSPPALTTTLEADKAIRLPEADLLTLTGPGLPELRTVVDEVTEFTVSHAGVGDSVAGPITIAIVAGKPELRGGRISMRKVISPRLGE